MQTDLIINYQEMMDLYNDIKRDVRRKNPRFYERWKAGGFIIDEDIVSMYPYLGQCPEIEHGYEDENDDDFED